MQRDVKAILDGVMGGGIATVGMSALMLVAREAGLMGEQPPEKITAMALDAVEIEDPDEATQDVLASLLHFGIGTGALFAVLHCRLPFRVPAAVHGVVFGSLVWLLSYQGWVPALGIMPSASRDRPDRPRVMLVAHRVYGAILGTIVACRDDRAGDDAHGASAR